MRVFILIILLFALLEPICSAQGETILVVQPTDPEKYYSNNFQSNRYEFEAYIIDSTEGNDITLKYKIDNSAAAALQAVKSNGATVKLNGSIIFNDPLDSGQHNLTFWTESASGNSEEVVFSFSVDNDPPSIDITGDITKYQISPYQLTFDVEDRTSGVSKICIQGPDAEEVCGKNKFVNLTINGEYVIKAIDNAGNVNTETIEATKIIESFTLSSTNIVMKPNEKFQIQAQVNNTYNTDLVWSSDDNSVAEVDRFGLITGNGIGETIIHAKLGEIDYQIQVRVMNSKPILFSTVAPEKVTIGTSSKLTAMLTYEDGTLLNKSSEVTWNISDPVIARISPDGTLEGLKEGVVSVYATLQTDSLLSSKVKSITIVPPYITSLEVTPKGASISIGARQTFTATATYSNEEREDVTSQTTWHSSNQQAATIYNATTGEILGIDTGISDITASLEDITSSPVTVYVGNPLISDLIVMPYPLVVPQYGSLKFQVISVNRNSLNEDVTAKATLSIVEKSDWDRQRIRLKNQPIYFASHATLYGNQIGTYHLTYSLGTITKTVEVHVMKSLKTLYITPGRQKVTSGEKIYYKATGIYTDGSSEDLTTLVQWDSVDHEKIRSTATEEQGGEFTAGIVLGVTQVSANYQGITAFADVEVTNEKLAPQSAPRICTINWYDD